MKIMLFSDTFPPEINGVATSTYNLYNILRQNGDEVYVVTTNPFTRKMTMVDNVIRLYGIELKKLYGYRMARFYYPSAMKLIKKIKPEVVHIQTDAGIGIFGKLVARRLHLPTVYTYHTMYEDYTYYVTKGKGIFDIFAKKIVKSYSRTIANRSTEFISPSIKTKDILRSYGIDNYINIVPTGIDFKKYMPTATKQERIIEFKKSHNLEKDFIVLSLGRVAKEKSIDVCIRGFADFKQKYPLIPIKMLIVGGGPARLELEALANELKMTSSIIFIGPVPAEEVPFYYHLADLFVSASITETQGLTFMEAMASQTLVLARFDENLVDVINDNETGFFFHEQDDFANMLNRILSLDEETKRRIKDKALITVDGFSIEKFYENIMEVYHRAIRKTW